MSEDRLKKVDMQKIERAVHEILEAVGEDTSREGLKDTPARVARMLSETLSGMSHDPTEYTKSIFHENYNEIVLLRDIPFYSTCEHHMMPFIGKAHVAYLPDGRIIGVSKLARIVDCFAKRLQVQERLTEQVADFLMEKLQPKGVAIVVEATHSCMTIRGVKKPGSVMVTSALRGAFIKSDKSRAEVLNLMHNDRR